MQSVWHPRFFPCHLALHQPTEVSVPRRVAAAAPSAVGELQRPPLPHMRARRVHPAGKLQQRPVAYSKSSSRLASRNAVRGCMLIPRWAIEMSKRNATRSTGFFCLTHGKALQRCPKQGPSNDVGSI
jgi:hypothetical protein